MIADSFGARQRTNHYRSLDFKHGKPCTADALREFVRNATGQRSAAASAADAGGAAGSAAGSAGSDTAESAQAQAQPAEEQKQEKQPLPLRGLCVLHVIDLHKIAPVVPGRETVLCFLTSVLVPS